MNLFPEALRARFQPRRQLGAGGMGIVVEVHDRERDAVLALKVIHGFDDATALARFEREAAALTRVQHPNVLRVHEHGVVEGKPWLLTEVLEGTNLEALPADQDPLPPLMDVARALDALHGQGLLHRDIKPANMFLTVDGRGVLLDFGLAYERERTRLTATGMVVGTPAYIAPELIVGQDPSPASDWYAWGISLHRLLEGEVPYSVESILKALQSGLWRPPTFRRLSPEDPRARAIQHLSLPSPTHRPRTLRDIEALLEGRTLPQLASSSWTLEVPDDALADLPVTTARRPRPAPGLDPATLAPPSTTRFGPAGLGVAAALGLAVAWGLSSLPRSPGPTPPPATTTPGARPATTQPGDPTTATASPAKTAAAEAAAAEAEYRQAAAALTRHLDAFTTRYSDPPRVPEVEARLRAVLDPDHGPAWTRLLDATQAWAEHPPSPFPDHTASSFQDLFQRPLRRNFDHLNHLAEDLLDPLFHLELAGEWSSPDLADTETLKRAVAACEEQIRRYQTRIGRLPDHGWGTLIQAVALLNHDHENRTRISNRLLELLAREELAPSLVVHGLRMVAIDLHDRTHDGDLPPTAYHRVIEAAQPYLDGARPGLTADGHVEIAGRILNQLLYRQRQAPDDPVFQAAYPRLVRHLRDAPASLSDEVQARLELAARSCRKVAPPDHPCHQDLD